MSIALFDTAAGFLQWIGEADSHEDAIRAHFDDVGYNEDVDYGFRALTLTEEQAAALSAWWEAAGKGGDYPADVPAGTAYESYDVKRIMGGLYYEVSINAATDGFGEYQCEPINGDGWSSEEELLQQIEQAVADDDGRVIELGVGNDDPEVDDICGRIHNEPPRVFAAVYGGDRGTSYFGITRR